MLRHQVDWRRRKRVNIEQFLILNFSGLTIWNVPSPSLCYTVDWDKVYKLFQVVFGREDYHHVNIHTLIEATMFSYTTTFSYTTICDQIWENRHYGNCCFELWAKIYTWLPYHGFSDYHTMKSYYPLPFSWRWSDVHTSPHLSRWRISFCSLVPPLITFNGEMLTWRQCYYGYSSCSMSVSVLPLACSHNQTALQVAIDGSTLSQEDSRIIVNHQQTVQRTLWPSVGMSASRVIASVYVVYENHS